MSLQPGAYEVRFHQGDVEVARGTFTLGGDDQTIGPVEFRSTSTHVQWRSPVGAGAWTNLLPIDQLPRGPAGRDGDPGRDGVDGAEVQMRYQSQLLQWKLSTETTWKTLFSAADIGGGGGGPGIVVQGAHITSADLGYVPSGNPVTDTANIQAFVDYIADNNLHGYLTAGQWEINREIILPDGVKLHGMGIGQTIINGELSTWTASSYRMLSRDNYSQGVSEVGVHLSDFTLIGPDKGASRNGASISLGAIQDFTIERVEVRDASNAGIRVTGYGEGSFTNDIHGDFWNNSHRGVIQFCKVRGGSLGIELEGGAESVDVLHNDVAGTALHGIRLPSAYCSTLEGNKLRDCQNAIWIDRHRDIIVQKNIVKNCQRGVVYGGFDTESSNDGIESTNLQILGNILTVTGSCITDAYQGNRIKNTTGVIIKDNICQGARIQLLWTKNVLISGNVNNGGSFINTRNDCTGLVFGNAMNLVNDSSGVTDGGNNVSVI